MLDLYRFAFRFAYNTRSWCVHVCCTVFSYAWHKFWYRSCKSGCKITASN